jgi:hypothetical protein
MAASLLSACGGGSSGPTDGTATEARETLAATAPATTTTGALAAAVGLAWSRPLPDATVGGDVQLTLQGQALRNVEVFQAGKMLVRATVSQDLKTASAVLDTRQFPDGVVTLSAHAWNSPAGTAFTSEGDAGSLRLMVRNAAPTPTWKKMVDEAGSFAVAGTVRVRYGAASSWIERSVSGTVNCTNAYFGRDPLYGVVKRCEMVASASSAPAPAPIPAPAPAPAPAPSPAPTPSPAPAPAPLDKTAPTACQLTAPAPGSDVRGSVDLKAVGRDDRAVTAIAFHRTPGGLIARGSAQSAGEFKTSWDTGTVADGPVQLHAICYDAAGNASAASAATTVWISNKRGALMGLNGPLDKEHVDAQADELRMRWVRYDAQWAWVQGDESAYVREMAAARATGALWPGLVELRDRIQYARGKGLRVLLIAQGTLPWVRGADRTDGGNPWMQAPLPARRGDFAEYVKQLCLAGADAVEITNEPNFKSHYAFGPDHPRRAYPDERADDYALLVRAVYTQVKADPRTRACQIGLAGPAVFGHDKLGSPDGFLPVDWTHRLLNAKADDRVTPAGVAGYFDFASVHPYADSNSETGPIDWGKGWIQPADTLWWQGIAQTGRMRAELLAGGAGGAKLWATELGAPTYGGQCPGKPCISEALQAAWVDDYVKAWLTNGLSGFTAPLPTRFFADITGPMFFYQWRDRSNGSVAPTDREGFFGVTRYDASRKPAFERLKAQAAMPR